MTDVYLSDPESKEIVGCLSFAPAEFENIRTVSRLIGDVGVRIFDIVSGTNEYVVVQEKNIHFIH